MKITFKIHKDKDWEEYRVQVYEDGEVVPGRTYYTDDKQDALDTKKAMIKEEKENDKTKNLR